MAYTASKLIKIAEAEVGYLEKASNSQLDDKTANAGSNNYTKYARDLYKAGYYNGNKNGYAWCDVFVDWCFHQLCDKNATKAQDMICQTGDCGAGCGYSMRYYKAQNRFYTSPKVGDQIFFGTSSNVEHTGIVYAVDDSKVYTIEGNTSGASGVISNGGGVCKKSYSRSYSRIVGYGRPKYDAEETTETTETTETKTLIQLAREVLKGKWGNGSARKANLTAAGYDYYAVQSEVNRLVNSSKKSNETVAKEVIQGKWGNGTDRKNRLTSAGYDYATIQALVNQMLR